MPKKSKADVALKGHAQTIQRLARRNNRLDRALFILQAIHDVNTGNNNIDTDAAYDDFKERIAKNGIKELKFGGKKATKDDDYNTAEDTFKEHFFSGIKKSGNARAKVLNAVIHETKLLTGAKKDDDDAKDKAAAGKSETVAEDSGRDEEGDDSSDDRFDTAEDTGNEDGDESESDGPKEKTAAAAAGAAASSGSASAPGEVLYSGGVIGPYNENAQASLRKFLDEHSDDPKFDAVIDAAEALYKNTDALTNVIKLKHLKDLENAMDAIGADDDALYVDVIVRFLKHSKTTFKDLVSEHAYARMANSAKATRVNDEWGFTDLVKGRLKVYKGKDISAEETKIMKYFRTYDEKLRPLAVIYWQKITPSHRRRVADDAKKIIGEYWNFKTDPTGLEARAISVLNVLKDKSFTDTGSERIASWKATTEKNKKAEAEKKADADKKNASDASSTSATDPAKAPAAAPAAAAPAGSGRKGVTDMFWSFLGYGDDDAKTTVIDEPNGSSAIAPPNYPKTAAKVAVPTTIKLSDDTKTSILRATVADRQLGRWVLHLERDTAEYVDSLDADAEE